MKHNFSRFFIFILVIYWLLGLFLLQYFQYQINPDGISLMGIAQKYFQGDISNAINGFWGPLFSWLLLPFLYFGVNSLMASKLLTLSLGFLTLIGGELLSYRFEMSDLIRKMILISLVPIILYFALTLISADLLVVCLLVYYFYLIFDSKYIEKPKRGILAGFLGGLGYLAKTYFFPFFLAHFLLFNLLHYLNGKTWGRKKVVLRNLVLGLIIFLVISLSWAVIISNKYGQITIGASGKYNHALVGPMGGHPMDYLGLLEPPNEIAISIWEDPSYIEVKSWNPFASWNFFKFKLRLIIEASYSVYRYIQGFSSLSIAIVIGFLLLLILPPRKIISQTEVTYPLLTAGLYASGYILISWIRERYLWILWLLSLLMGGYLLNLILVNKFFTKFRKKAVLALFALTFVVLPIKNLVINLHTGEEVYTLSQRLKTQYDFHGRRLASNKNWHESLLLSYHLSARYYGLPKQDVSPEEVFQESTDNKIDYFLIWGETKKEELPELTIFPLNK